MPLFKADQKFGEGLDMDRWLVVRKIGEGQFAEVYEVIDLFEQEEQRVRAVGFGRAASACSLHCL